MPTRHLDWGPNDWLISRRPLRDGRTLEIGAQRIAGGWLMPSAKLDGWLVAFGVVLPLPPTLAVVDEDGCGVVSASEWPSLARQTRYSHYLWGGPYVVALTASEADELERVSRLKQAS